MGAPKGNQFSKGISKKGRSGRKKKAEELRIYINKIKEEITQEALIALANKKVFAAIDKANTHFKIKDIALPVTLKGMTEKTENKNKFDFEDEKLKEKLADKLIKLLEKKK